jgi:hypothetical protein
MQKAPFQERQYRRGSDAATDALGEARYAQAYDQGRAMRVEEATDYLLRE